FDLDATLPLMAVQVVLLTFILNALFFSPVGRVVEEREGYVTTSRAEAKQKLAQAERLEADLKAQLKDARLAAQKLIQEAEQDSDKLYRDALAAATADDVAQIGLKLGFEFSGDELLRVSGQRFDRVTVRKNDIPGEYN
ncbi:MAG: hypothetical protein RJA29_963, partial [Pseudomonadota bacterium]